MSKEKIKTNPNPVGATISFPHFEENAKNQRGITLVALVITIIVMLILVGVTVTVAISGGLFNKTKEGANGYDKSKDIDQIASAYALQFQVEKESSSDKTNKELFEDVKNNLGFEGATYNITSEYMNIVKKDGTQYILFADGTIIEEKLVYLDIADGSIELKSNGYIQGENELVEHTGSYIITGTTTENTVKVMEQGTYNITIKDLNIDVSSISATCAFDANAGKKPEGCYVNLTLEGNNFLCSNAMAGLSFCRRNIVVENNRSTLTIKGNGYLDTRCIAGYDGAGIGGNYNPSAVVCDIIIESGNITAIGRGNACGIGGGLRQDVDNIVINGGNIIAKAGNRCGIGAAGKVNYIEINGGNITANGGEYGTGIGGSGVVKINGGNIVATRTYDRNAIGGDEVIITGGTINAIGNRGQGIYCSEGKNIVITGGNILARGKNYNIATYEGENLIQYIPKDGTNNLYETQIKLNEVEAEKKIASIMINGNSENYGIKDMYTIEDGMLYLYLPLGTRTITIEAEGNMYSGTVETKEEAEVVVLNKQ